MIPQSVVIPHKVLVTGGVRSGKSHYAEALLTDAEQVAYIAPGPAPDPLTDPEWADRIAAHRNRRPAHWQTYETHHLAAVLNEVSGPVLIDSLGTWLTAVIDDLGTWDQPLDDWRQDFSDQLDAFEAGWRQAEGPIIAVTNEVGWGVVSEHRSGRIFADLLGCTNQRIAALSDDVVLLVAGRPLHL